MDEMGKEANLMGHSLSEHTVDYLKNWMLSPEHIQNPYPTPHEKIQIMQDTGIEKKQLICWFSNNRKRIWKVKIDELKQLYGLSEEDNLSDEHWEMYARTATAVNPASFSANPPPPPPADFSIAHMPPPSLNNDVDPTLPVPPPDLNEVEVDYAAIAAAEVVESMMREQEEPGHEKKKQKTEDKVEVESYAV